MLLTIVVFLVVSAAVYVAFELLGRRKHHVQLRMEQMAPGVSVADPEEGRNGTEMARPTVDALDQLVTGNERGKKLRLEMMRAGLRLRPVEFIAICIASSAVVGLLGMVATNQLGLAVLFGVVGAFVPVGVLKQRQQKRARQFNNQISDALTLIVSSLRSGYSFARAMQLVADEMPAPISEEFTFALGEVSLGVAVEVALQRMVERTQSYDLDLVVTAVTIQLQVGGNLAEILGTIADTIRERVRVQREIDVLTAEGKLSGVILFLLPIAVGGMILVNNPGYFKPILTYPLGIPILVGTLVVQMIGGLIIKRMVALDV